MQADEFIFPFVNQRPPTDDSSFFKSMQTRFLPHLKLASISTFLLGLNILIFVIIHILFKPSSYARFLDWPSEMNKWLLEVEMVKTNKMYFYQAFTALFMHESYLHILNNTLFGLIIMYEMEHSYKWSIPLGVLGGFSANCLTILTLEGRFLGFSGVLTSYAGMIVLLLITHISYFESRMQGSFCWIIMIVVFLSLALFGPGQSSVLVHLYGYVMGMVLALGFFPKHPQSIVTGTCQTICRVVAGVIILAIIVLAAAL